MDNETENKLEENSFPEKLTFKEFVKFIFSKQQLNTTVFPIGWKTRPVYPLVLVYIVIYPLFGVIWGCTPNEETETPKVEQTNNSASVPEIKVIDNRLFVGDKEMLAKDFVEKYCFANKDNQTCVKASILRNVQNTLKVGEKPKNW